MKKLLLLFVVLLTFSSCEFIFGLFFISSENEVNQPMNNLEEKQEIIDSINTEISEMEDKLDRLNNDQKELEKFARENFLIKKDNEDIIIIRDLGDE